MSRKAWLMVFGAGVLVGLIVAFVSPFGPTQPRAAAQQPAKADPPRFQVSAFAYPGYVFPNSSEVKGGYGAYFVDTQKGDVWALFGDGKPKRLGKLE